MYYEEKGYGQFGYLADTICVGLTLDVDTVDYDDVSIDTCRWR